MSKSFSYVPGSGPADSQLMIVSDFPSEFEEAKGQSLVGPVGNIVQRMIENAGGIWSKCYKTNVFKYRPPQNDMRLAYATGHKLEELVPQLFDEIKFIKPNAILALGDLALETLTGKSGATHYRGSILPLASPTPSKVIPTIHPQKLFKPSIGEDGEKKGMIGYEARIYIQLDVKRAVEEAKSPRLDLPTRNLAVARDSASVHAFIEKNLLWKKDLCAVDIEVINTIPVCVALCFGPAEAISCPLVNFGDLNLPDAELAEIWRLLTTLFANPAIRFIGQNFKFDEKKLRGLGMRFVNFHADTSMMAHTLHPEFPKKLEFLASIYTREPYYKDEGREFWKFGVGSVKQFMEYNCKDVCVTWEVYQALRKDLEELGLWQFYLDIVHPQHYFYSALEDEGLCIDEDKRAELLLKYHLMKIDEEEKLFKAIGASFNINSPKQVASVLYDDLKFPRRDGTGEEVLTALYANHAKNEAQKVVIDGILKLRQINKTIGTYLSAYPDWDGRMRCSYQICGTDTGRSSTQVLKAPVRKNKLVFIYPSGKEDSPSSYGTAFHTMTKHGDVGADLRSMFVASPASSVHKHVFMNFDLSQAEPRVVALLSEDYELLQMFEDGIDIHRWTASLFFGIKDWRDIPKSDPKRFIGKTGRNAGNYDAQKHRLMLTINTDAKKYGIPIRVSEAEAGKILTSFHTFSPKIRANFHQGIRRSLRDNNNTLYNPFGRRRQFFARPGHDLEKSAFAHIPQSTIKDHLITAMLRMAKIKPTLKFVLEAHDAGMICCLADEKEIKENYQIIKQELEKPIDFEKCSLKRRPLRIPCEVEVGENYLDLKKVEF